MELTFTDEKGHSELLAKSDDISALKAKASDHYAGDELVMWESGPSGKPYSEHVAEVPCTFNLNNGSSYTIS